MISKIILQSPKMIEHMTDLEKIQTNQDKHLRNWYSWPLMFCSVGCMKNLKTKSGKDWTKWLLFIVFMFVLCDFN